MGAGLIEELAAEGLVSAYPDGTYRPDRAVTRAETAVFMLRAEHGPGYTPPPASGSSFSDTNGHWAENWIEQLVTEGIVSGYPAGTYGPDDSVSHAQIAVSLDWTFGITGP
jgi:hypothetical protein